MADKKHHPHTTDHHDQHHHAAHHPHHNNAEHKKVSAVLEGNPDLIAQVQKVSIHLKSTTHDAHAHAHHDGSAAHHTPHKPHQHKGAHHEK